MGEVHYMISEAAKQVQVEPHVLRHWEDELGLAVGRTEMGHRYYTQENIRLFRCIKELKEQGMLLKDLKALIPDLLKTRDILEEERYKQLDCLIRRQQSYRKEYAKAAPLRQWKRLFGT